MDKTTLKFSITVPSAMSIAEVRNLYAEVRFTVDRVLDVNEEFDHCNLSPAVEIEE